MKPAFEELDAGAYRLARERDGCTPRWYERFGVGVKGYYVYPSPRDPWGRVVLLRRTPSRWRLVRVVQAWRREQRLAHEYGHSLGVNHEDVPWWDLMGTFALPLADSRSVMEKSRAWRAETTRGSR